jgi:tryptophan synthase alpha chain
VSRITRRFAALKKEGRAGLITYFMAGDPDLETSYRILAGLPKAGADLIELGMPFTDPMADGPAIQLAGQRALKAGTRLDDVLGMVQRYRRETGDDDTPMVVMGYFNLIYQRGAERFCRAAAAAGIDGMIVVDLAPEEADQLKPAADAAGLDTVFLAAPTTDDKRLPAVLKHASGFLYFVSILGITGTKAVPEEAARQHVLRLRKHTDLPIGVGFGIRTADNARAIASVADAAVVGTGIVDRVKAGLDGDGKAMPGLVDGVMAYVRELSEGVKSARR